MIMMILMIMHQLDAPLPIHDHYCSMTKKDSHGVVGAKLIFIQLILFCQENMLWYNSRMFPNLDIKQNRWI